MPKFSRVHAYVDVTDATEAAATIEAAKGTQLEGLPFVHGAIEQDHPTPQPDTVPVLDETTKKMVKPPRPSPLPGAMRVVLIYQAA